MYKLILLPELRTISGFVALKTANIFFLKACAMCNGPESQQIIKSLSLTNLIKSLEDLLVFLKKKFFESYRKIWNSVKTSLLITSYMETLLIWVPSKGSSDCGRN